MEYIVKTELQGRTLSIQTGKVAKQASGSVVVRYGDTVVLVTAVTSDKELSSDFLPLSVEYQEKIYSVGRIPGNYFRREIGRPSEKEILTSRLIDRPIRPLFPEKYNFEIQIIATVLSMDKENDSDTLAMIGASAALELSCIPFAGPVACVRVGRVDGQFVLNPKISQYDDCDIDIIVAGSKDGVIMVEGGADIVSEKDMLDAILFAHKSMQPIIELQKELKAKAGKAKKEFVVPEKDKTLMNNLEKQAYSRFKEAIVKYSDKMERKKALSEIKTEIFEKLGETYTERKDEVSGMLSDIQKKVSRDLVLKDGRRIDNRKFDEIRPITCEVGFLPRAHGSALFTRGETQVLGVLTLGTGLDEQRIETLTNGDTQRSFMLHYNFPPFSVGETKRISGPSRRDIGHGNLACRAIEKVLPEKKEFDYTLRLVAEVLESNGSSSMGTVCASSLSLMNGGVPIKAAVSGIAMGLVKEGDKVVILSDILGDEDHTGDMDFKVAGTKDGITALQMDIKIHELSSEILEKALNQARDGRLFILNKMNEEITKPNKELSSFAPTVCSLQINADKIREIIGPGGKVIRLIQSETQTKVEINDSGLITIAASSKKEVDAAIQMINEIVKEPVVGEIYDGTVMKITDFGAFVQIMPKTDGLVHISQLESHHVKKVSDVVNVGDSIKVKVIDIDKFGKIRLSKKAVDQELNE